MEPPVLVFKGWSCIVHLDKSGVPKWFSYWVWARFDKLSVQMAIDLSAHFKSEITVYDVFGANGEGTARIKY